MRNFLSERVSERWIIFFLALVSLGFRAYQLNQNPPGLQGDELFNIVDSLKIGTDGWPLYFPGNNGREVLFFYPVALFLNLFGQSIFVARLPAALFGTGSVVLCYLIGRQHFSKRVALSAALLMAVSLWPIMSSRWVLRAVSLTFFSALSVYLSGLGFQKASWRWYFAAGIAIGLTLYTYIPARLFPLVIVAWLLYISLFNLKQARFFKNQLRDIGILWGTAALTFLPFALYMANNWGAVNNRINDFDSAMGQALEGNILALWVPISASLKLFTILGDLDWRYHVSGQPAFNLLSGIFFYIGLIVAFWRIVRREETAWSAYGMLFIWLLAMLAPNMVVDDKPTFLRLAGGVVPTFLLFGIGIDEVSKRIGDWRPSFKPVAHTLLTIIVLMTAVQTANSLFRTWPSQPKVREIYQSEQQAIGHFINQNRPEEGTRLIIADRFVYDVPTIVGFGFYTDQDVDWVSNADGFLIPSDEQSTQPSWYLVPHSKPLNQEIRPLTEPLTQISHSFPNGDPAFTQIMLDSQDLMSGFGIDQTINVQFEDAPQLIGYGLDSIMVEGEQVQLRLVWEVPPNQPRLSNQLLSTRVLLEDEDGTVWDQSDHFFGYPQASWRPNDRYIQLINIATPTGMPPKPLYFRVQLRDTNDQLRNLLSGGPPLAGPYVAQGKPVEDFQPFANNQTFLDEQGDPQIYLAEGRYSTLISPGVPQNISFDWVIERQPDEDLRLNIKLIQPETGETVFEVEAIPWQESFPPSQWAAGTRISTHHALQLPQQYDDPAPLVVDARWVSETTGPLNMANESANQLPPIDLEIREYLFDIPAIETGTDVQFGESINLLGYDLDLANSKRGGSVGLILYWQAIETPKRAYTVFNHVRQAPGGEIIAQFDSPPVNEAWATANWVPNEVVIDRREISISPDSPAGTFPLYIGLYSASDLSRPEVFRDGEQQPDNQLFLTEITIRE